MATLLETLATESDFLEEKLPTYYRAVLKNFRKISSFFVHFNLFFLTLFLVETILFVSFFSTLSLLFALLASSLFATTFSYFVLLFYFQSRKQEKFEKLSQEFLSSCRKLLSSPIGKDQHHLCVAVSLTKLSSYLDDFEWEFYKIPSFLQFCSPAVSWLSAYFYWKDVFKLKQMLLLSAIEEHIEQIRKTPTDLEVHASLGNTYVTLSKLYREPIQNKDHPRIDKLKKIQAEYEEKSTAYSRLAIEEFKILSYYASNDPWIHEQMALGYKNLNLKEEETKEVETLLKLKPQDKEILFRLGSLYFSQGLNAKGLQVYEELKKTHSKKAEELISSYGIVD